MSGLSAVETAAGLLLVFFVPGYAIAKALFPDWRVRGREGLRRLVELVTLSFLLSVVLTVLVGYFEMTLAPGGFRSYWADPVLEVSLTAVAVVAFALGLARGAYRTVPPPRPAVAPYGGEEGVFDLTLELDRLRREGQRIRHALRTGSPTASERDRLRTRLEEVEGASAELQRRREAEYAH